MPKDINAAIGLDELAVVPGELHLAAESTVGLAGGMAAAARVGE